MQKLSPKLKIIIPSIIVILLLVGLGFYFFKTGGNKSSTQYSSKTGDSSDILKNAPQIWSYQTRNKYLGGEWTKEEFILNNLAYITGQNKDNQLGNDLEVDSINTTVRVAKSYLLEGTDQSIKDKIDGYLKIIYPSRFYSGKKSAKTVDFFGSVNVNAEEEYTGPFVQFDTPGFGDVIFGHTITFPDDPTFNRDSVELIKTAIIDSYQKYMELGFPLEPASVALVPNALSSGRLRVQASAILSNERDACNITVFLPFFREFNSTSGIDRAKLKQVIAHEIFHCVQDVNYSGQFSHYVTNNGLYNAWNIEGGAEFFSNVVYPTYDLENQFNSTFNDTSPENQIYKMSYEAYIFHQFLANNIGIDGLKNLYSSMPTSGRFDEQRTALSSFPNMDNLFHDFAKEYLDNKIRDTNGSYKILNPTFNTVRTISETSRIRNQTLPFVVNRSIHSYVYGNRYFNIVTTQDPTPAGKYNVKKAESEIWELMPEEVPVFLPTAGNTGGSDYCSTGNSNQSDIKIVQTSTADTGEQNTLTFDITAVGDNTNSDSETETRIDRRLIGAWKGNAESNKRAAETIVRSNAIQGGVIIDDYYYDTSVCFEANGNFFSDTVLDINYRVDFGSGDTLPVNITLFSSSFGKYSASGGNLNFEEIYENAVGQIASMGNVTPIGSTPLTPAQRTDVNDVLNRVTQRDAVTNRYSPQTLLLRRILRTRLFSDSGTLPPTPGRSSPYRFEGNTVVYNVPLSPYPEVFIERVGW